MTSCPSCGESMESLPSWSGNPRLSWERCPACRRMELAVDESVPPRGGLVRAEYDFERLREIERGGKIS